MTLLNIFYISILIVIALIPILIWGYVFSSFDNSTFNRKRFVIGIFAGSLSVLPVLKIGKIIDYFSINIFDYIHKVTGFLSTWNIFTSAFIFVLIIALASILGGFLLPIGIKNKTKYLSKIYFKNITVFFIFTLLLSILIYIINYFFKLIPAWDFSVEGAVSFNGIEFNTLKLILFYYIVIAFLEESSKYFNFMQSSLSSINNIKNGVLYAIFVGLGFSFIENIMYFYNIVSHNGFSKDFIFTFFTRSIFSVLVHLLCSSIVGYYFTKAYLNYKKTQIIFPYIKVFLYGLFLSILLHMIFDVSLTLGFSFIIFIYFIGGYLYITKILISEDF